MKPADPTANPDELVARLVELARGASAGAPPAPGEDGLRSLELALLRRGRRPARVLWALLPAAALGAGAGVYALRERTITFEVVSGKVGDGGYVTSGPSQGAVRFSDQSDLGLEPGTRLRITDLEVRGARVMLEGGTLHARIHSRPRNRWTLAAGPYIVHVTGTRFDLAWRVDEQTLDLRLREGSVVVEGPLAEAGLKVAAGQHLIANANADTLSLEESGSGAAIGSSSTSSSGTAPSVPAVGAAPSGGSTAPASAEAPDPSSAASGPASGPERSSASNAPAAPGSRGASPSASGGQTLARGAGPVGHAREGGQASWGSRVATGDFDGVLDEAERRGLGRALAEASRSDLAALADAARYARRQEVAVRALTAERARFPGTVQARDASFFLAGLAEGQKSDGAALDWYDTYLRESPSGAYASQALGRKMMIVQRVTGAAQARPIALEYLARFPDGPYAPQARQLAEMQ
ncbi:MAG TPA: FecR domain-containing protein [Polyangiaceae bacterium]|nr:FecR domain-containing protein [Polyangiaceae bacterium]